MTVTTFDVDAFLREVVQLADTSELQAAPPPDAEPVPAPEAPAKPKRRPQRKAPLTPPPTPEPESRPSFPVPQVEAAPTLVEAIEAAVNKVLTGNHKATVAKRTALIAELTTNLANVPVYGIELDGARMPIGDGIDLDNAFIELDGYGRASRITVDAGTPIWD
jgi:hypothetical protein